MSNKIALIALKDELVRRLLKVKVIIHKMLLRYYIYIHDIEYELEKDTLRGIHTKKFHRYVLRKNGGDYL